MAFLKRFKKIYFFKFFKKNIKNNFKIIIFFKKSNIFFKNNLYSDKPKFKKKIIKKLVIKNYRSKFKKKKIYLKKYFFKKKKVFLKINKKIKNKAKIIRFKYFFLNKLKLNIDFLKCFFLKKNVKKKRLLEFFSKISKKRNNIVSLIDRFLIIILLRSHFFFFLADTKFFLKKGLVFINGFSNKNFLYLVKQSDRIQLPINKIYYLYIKKNFSFFKKKIKLIRYKRWRITKFQSKYKFKKWSPSFLQHFFFYKLDCPSNLEIDYTSLTIVFLRFEFNILKKNFLLMKFFSILFIKSYLWKKII